MTINHNLMKAVKLSDWYRDPTTANPEKLKAMYDDLVSAMSAREKTQLETLLQRGDIQALLDRIRDAWKPYKKDNGISYPAWQLKTIEKELTEIIKLYE